MTIRRRSLRKLLVLVGCLVGSVSLVNATVGLVLISAGAGLHLWSKGCLEQNRRLTTAGPYRFTRNPFYLANLVIDVGICCVIGRVWVAGFFLLIWWIAYRDTIAREQARLAELFPEDYGDYCQQVPALFPNGQVWPSERVTGRFSLDNDGLARGAEYARILGIFLSPLAIWAADIVRRNGLRIFDGQHDAELMLCLGLPVLWVWKLALAETFRRPETRLLPATGAAARRAPLAFALGLGMIFLATGHSWAAMLPVLWIGLIGLDAVGEARNRRGAGRAQTAWRYFPAVAAGSFLVFGCLSVLFLDFV